MPGMRDDQKKTAPEAPPAMPLRTLMLSAVEAQRLAEHLRQAARALPAGRIVRLMITGGTWAVSIEES